MQKCPVVKNTEESVVRPRVMQSRLMQMLSWVKWYKGFPYCATRLQSSLLPQAVRILNSNHFYTILQRIKKNYHHIFIYNFFIHLYNFCFVTSIKGLQTFLQPCCETIKSIFNLHLKVWDQSRIFIQNRHKLVYKFPVKLRLFNFFVKLTHYTPSHVPLRCYKGTFNQCKAMSGWKGHLPIARE